MTGKVIAVAGDSEYRFSKPTKDSIRLIEGLGVEGDAHNGVTVKHRSRIRRDPTVLNIRQVHLMHQELFDELRPKGFDILPGQIGENITTKDLDLLGLPRGTKLKIGGALIELTGLRNPCKQLDDFQKGLMKAVLDKDADGNLIRKSGVMGIVLKTGDVSPGDVISVELPSPPHHPLEPV